MNQHVYGCNLYRLKNLRESRPPRPYAGMGEFAGMDDFEVVTYLVVLPETAPHY